MAITNRRLIHVALCALFALPGTVALLVANTANGQANEPAASPGATAVASHPLQALYEASNSHPLIWLGEEAPFIARYDEAAQPRQMAVLGFYRYSNQLNEPAVLPALHDALPLQGWHVLSILLNDTPPAAPSGTSHSAAQPDTAASGDPANSADPTPDDVSNSASARTASAITYLKQQNAASVALFSDNRHAITSLEAAITHKGFVSGLILWQVDSTALDLDKLKALRESRTSVLDIASSDYSKPEQAKRAQLFAKAGFTDDYTQLHLADDTPAEISVKRIRHWLDIKFQK